MRDFKINIDLSNYQKGIKLTERASVLKEILDIINSERVGTKYPKMTGRLLAIKVGHLKTDVLYYMLSVGRDYKHRKGSFSKYFFGSLKVISTA